MKIVLIFYNLALYTQIYTPCVTARKQSFSDCIQEGFLNKALIASSLRMLVSADFSPKTVTRKQRGRNIFI